MKKVVSLVLCLALSLSLASAALAQGRLTIYNAVFEDQGKAVAAAFQEATGIQTEVVTLGGGEILARVRAEKENATATIWFGGPCDSHITAGQEGLLTAYIAEEGKNIPDQYKDSEGLWYGTYVGYVGFVYNTQILEELGAKVPESWADLLQPELAKQIMMAGPDSSATGYVILASALQVMGEEEGFAYMEELDQQMLEYTARGSACIASVAQGEVAVGICFMHDAIKYILTNDTADFMGIVTPSEGTGYETGATAILADGPDQEEAKAFMEWNLTPEAMEIGRQYGAYQFVTNVNATQPDEAATLEGAKLIVYDTAYAGSNREAFTARWAQSVGR